MPDGEARQLLHRAMIALNRQRRFAFVDLDGSRTDSYLLAGSIQQFLKENQQDG